jgi:hypothetical protein
MGDNPSRKGQMLICPSCNGQMYVPQVLEKKSAFLAAAAASQAPTERRKAPPIKARPASKQGFISSTGVAITLIILGIVVIGGGGLGIAGYLVYKSSRERIDAQNERKVADEAAKVLREKEEEKAGDIGPSALSNARPTSADLSAIRSAFLSMVEASQETDEDYAADLRKAGLERLLVADRVAKDTTFRESRDMLTDIRGVVELYRVESTGHVQRFIEDLEAVKYQGLPKEEFVASIRAAIAPLETEMEKVWKHQKGIIDQYENAIRHLEATQGTWKLEGDSLKFSNVKDAEQYKQFFVEVDKHTQSQFDTFKKFLQEDQVMQLWQANAKQ